MIIYGGYIIISLAYTSAAIGTQLGILFERVQDDEILYDPNVSVKFTSACRTCIAETGSFSER